MWDVIDLLNSLAGFIIFITVLVLVILSFIFYLPYLVCAAFFVFVITWLLLKVKKENK